MTLGYMTKLRDIIMRKVDHIIRLRMIHNLSVLWSWHYIKVAINLLKIKIVVFKVVSLEIARLESLIQFAAARAANTRPRKSIY